MPPKKDQFSARDEEFATNLKWGLWNEVWFIANSSLASESSSGTQKQALLSKADKDLKRADEHYEKVRILKVHTPVTIAGLRDVAVAAGHEGFRSGMSGIPVTATFMQEVSRQSRTQAASVELGEQAWPLFLSMVCTMAQVVSADILKDKIRKRQYKDVFTQASDRFEVVLCESLALGRQTGSAIQQKSAPAQPRMRYSSQLAPKQRVHWTVAEKELVRRTRGLYVPKIVPPDCGKDRVSVLTPTVEKRQRFHELLWSCFQAQTWPNKELVVVETYQEKPSEIFVELSKTDVRLVYIGVQVDSSEYGDWSIGFKRNFGAALATGDIIAHFDDDDLYAPDYVTTMVQEMLSRSCVAITLSSWYIFEMGSSSIGYCNPSLDGGGLVDAEDMKELTYGFGFSYVYKRETVLEHPYQDINMGEDYDFFSKVLEAYGQHSIALLEDKYGLCLHTQHGGNTSQSFALYETPEGQIKELDFFHFYPVFDWYRELAEEKKESLQPDETFAYAVERQGAFRSRSRAVTVHTKTSKLKCHCSVGATCADLLGQLKKQSTTWPDGAMLFRIPQRFDVPEREQLAIMKKTLEIMCPIAPPLEEYFKKSPKIDPRLKHLLQRIYAPLDNDDLLGAKTTDLWAAWPNNKSGYPGQ